MANVYIIRYGFDTEDGHTEGLIVQKHFSRAMVEEAVRNMNKVYGEGTHRLIEFEDRAAFYFLEPKYTDQFIDIGASQALANIEAVNEFKI